MRTLHELPRFKDRWSYLYLEMGTLDQTAAGLAFRNKSGDRDVPIDQLYSARAGLIATRSVSERQGLAYASGCYQDSPRGE